MRQERQERSGRQEQPGQHVPVSEWDLAYHDLALAILREGYPEEFAHVLAHELGSPKAMRRLAGYVRNARPQSVEQIVDEMLVVVEERRRWQERKMSEHANASLTAFYNRPREDES